MILIEQLNNSDIIVSIAKTVNRVVGKKVLINFNLTIINEFLMNCAVS